MPKLRLMHQAKRSGDTVLSDFLKRAFHSGIRGAKTLRLQLRLPIQYRDGTMNEYQTAIVFQGGGALGAYEYGVIKALYEQRPGFKPAAVTGMSIGAINAALLVGAAHDSLETLEEVWCNRFTEILPRPVATLFGPPVTQKIEQCLSSFGNAGMYQLRQDHWLEPCQRTSIYDLEPLRRTLREFIDADQLNRSDHIRLVIGAVNVASGEPRYFDNQHERLEIEHIIASASLPPAFPLTPIGEEYYWDGGLFQNTPLSSAINCLEQATGDCRREVIVVELFPQHAPLPRDMAAVMNRYGQLLFDSKLKIDRKLFRTINDTITFLEKIEPHIPDQFKHDPAYREIFARHKKIDALTVITADFPEDRANAGDFSRATIRWRIELGYEQAIRQHIATPHPVE
jgi:NTE family protein